MKPESPLFPAYQEALELDAAAIDFNQRANAAFNTLFEADRVPNQTGKKAHELIDAQEVQTSLQVSGVPDGQVIARSFERIEEDRPIRVEVRPAYESFENEGRTVESRVGFVMGAARNHTVLRLVVMTQNAQQLPDSRGYYVARSSIGILTFFRIETDDSPIPERFTTSYYAGATVTARTAKPPTPLEEAASGGRPAQRFKAVSLEPHERLAMLEELEKAVAVLPQPDRKVIK